MSKKEKSNDKDNFLLYIPVIKHNDWEIRNGFVYLVFYHNKFAEKVLQWLAKKPSVSDVKLDRLGTSVWQNIDGENNVYEIGKLLLNMPELKKEYKDITEDDYIEGCHPIYSRLIMFLRYMVKKGWIKFKVAENHEQKNDELE